MHNLVGTDINWVCGSHLSVLGTSVACTWWGDYIILLEQTITIGETWQAESGTNGLQDPWILHLSK